MSKKIKKYNQFTAFLAIVKVSFLGLLRNPSSIVFSMIFPVVFISIFGLIGSNSSELKIYLNSGADKNNPIYTTLETMKTIKFEEYNSNEAAVKNLKIGQLDAILDIKNISGKFLVNLQTSNAAAQNGSIISSIITGITDKINLSISQIQNPLITLNSEVISGREYKQIDFILPGQLGFSLLSSGIFGTAFVLISLQETLVLKRFFATPIKRLYILLAEGISRLLLYVIQMGILIGFGHFVFGFTLINGFTTFFQMLLIVVFGLIVFLGAGLLISSVAKDENSVAPIANMFTLPQFLLAGSFFPITLLPKWLQAVSNILPLTHLNEAMRKIAFEGAGFTDIFKNLLVLLIWAIVVYGLAAKLFKWEK
ncbi:ABC transporter permease [Candidatus Dojkabacteria bacterium]|jgi:ABC-2 type transport system permease protein|nr:ABC transporter permease [Candidatus Dojkabacteria bacterium]